MNKVALRIPAIQLEPGMITPDWEVLEEPVIRASEENPDEEVVVVRMRHRVDGGESNIAYDLDAEVTFVTDDPDVAAQFADLEVGRPATGPR